MEKVLYKQRGDRVKNKFFIRTSWSMRYDTALKKEVFEIRRK